MYELSGKHTYVPMSINVGCLIVLLLLLAAFYKELTPKSNTGETHYKFHLTAPSVTLEKEIEYKGPYYIIISVFFLSNSVLYKYILFIIVLNFYIYMLLRV